MYCIHLHLVIQKHLFLQHFLSGKSDEYKGCYQGRVCKAAWKLILYLGGKYPNLYFAQRTRKGKTDKSVAHLDLFKRFKNTIPEDRYHVDVSKMFDNLPYLQTYDVETSTSVMTDRGVISMTSVLGNELTPTKQNQLPLLFVMKRNMKLRVK